VTPPGEKDKGRLPFPLPPCYTSRDATDG
jgi:hypothetical protein